jgi:cell wall-associated NlpC family hydrolase
MLLLAAGCFGEMASCEMAGITNYPPLVQAKYWQDKCEDADNIVGDAAAISCEIVKNSPSVYNLAAYPETADGSKIKSEMKTSASLDGEVYQNGQLVSAAARQRLDDELNLAALKEKIAVRYGVCVNHANLRALPSAEGIFASPYDNQFDNLQDTTLDAGEAVLILHTSLSGKFYYVQAVNYRGWVSAAAVAETDRQSWLSYAEMKNFLVTTARNFSLIEGGEKKLYQMGARLKLQAKTKTGWQVLVPFRTSDGSLAEKEVALAFSDDFNEGYLSYTRRNILAQAFKYYGAPYGWGGLFESEDCSGFIADVYKTVGIRLPRDADEQEESYGTHFYLSGLSSDERKSLICEKLLAGDVLAMNGHIVMYIGNIGGEPYIVHALGGYYEGGARIGVMRVVVSDLNLTLSSGRTHLEAFRQGVSWR